MIQFLKSRFIFSVCGLLAVGLALSAFTNADDDLVTIIGNQLAQFRKVYSQEKIYVHLDKPYYVSGEDIWYKAYLVNGTSHAPDSVSKNIYIELVGADGKIAARNILKVKAGVAIGDFNTSDSLNAGTYTLRAYTNWMRNFSDDYFFSQKVKILNDKSYASAPASPAGSKKAPVAPVTAKPLPALDVQFFPEGGNLVAGIESRIAFKAVNKFGKGENITGSVVDQANQEIISFTATNLGMGSFNLEPEAGKAYTAQVKSSNGQTYKFTLPVAQEKGFVMQASNLAKDVIRVGIKQNVVTGAPGKDIVLVAQARGQEVFAAKVTATGPSLGAVIPKANMPSGVVQITLFDATTKEPLCERLVFIDKSDNLKLTVTPNKASYKAREKVQLAITATDAQGSPVQTNFSLAVTDGQIKPDENGQNLNTYLLLSSDLKGTIEQPGAYFKDKTMATQMALDNLMLTQGWRRFIWKELLAGKIPPATFSTERSLLIGGVVTQIVNNKPVPNGKVLLSIMKPDLIMVPSQTDANGQFYISALDFYGSSDVLIQAEKDKGNQRVNIKLNEQVAPFSLQALIPTTEGSSEMTDYIKRVRDQQRSEEALAFGKGTKVLKTVEVTGQKVSLKEDRLYGAADQVVKVTPQMNTFSNILQAMMGKTAGLLVTSDGNVTLRGKTPLFMLNGFRTDVETLSTISPDEVESWEVVKNPATAAFIQGSDNGIIAVYLKKGSTGASRPREGSITVNLPGYYKAREFYAPTYDVKKEEHSLPDKRSTLYWNPMVKTDATGKATVTFFNADNVTAMQATLEGISNTGQTGSETIQIK